MDESSIDRVKRIIDESGLTQRAFAAAIDLDETKLTKSLNGQRAFSSLELALIANAGNRTVDWILGGAAPRALVFAHRKTLADRSIVDAAGTEVISTIAEYWDSLELLGYRAPSAPTLKHRNQRSFVVEANELAQSATDRIPGEISSLDLPSLIFAAEDAFALNVVTTPLPEGCDGLSYQDGDFRVIVLAQTENSVRQRNTLAHEIGHILWGDADKTVIEERLNTREGSRDERRANVFSASFTIPASELTRRLGEGTPLSEFDRLTWEFGVSPESMSWRMLNLGLIRSDERPALAAQSTAGVAYRLGTLKDHALRGQQSNSARPPWRLALRYFDAYRDGECTLAPIADILGWSLTEAQDFFAPTVIEGNTLGNPEDL